MSIFTKLFGQQQTSTKQSDESTGDSYRDGLHSSRKIPASYHAWTMPPGLETEGVSVAQFIQSTPNDRLRTTLRQLPIESLIFDDIDCILKKNGWALEVVMAFASQLATYKWRLKNQPDASRRSDLPADELKDLVIRRLTAALLKHTNDGHDVTPSLDRFFREELGRNLVAGEYPRDAKAIFEICQRQSYQPPAQRELMAFWIYFCLYRIAFVSKNGDDIRAALDASAKVTRPGIDDAAYRDTVEWLRKNR